MHYRYVIVGITAVAAMFMYIDRVCFSTLAPQIFKEILLPQAPEPSASDELTDVEIAEAKKQKFESNPQLDENTLELTSDEIIAAKKKKWADERMSYVLGAFFFTYALFQVPMGTLADRYGTRVVLALSIAAWSIVTMATGFVTGFAALFIIRLLLGVSEAAAYPAAAGLVKNWAPPEKRGLCSSIVALGGRLGGAIAPWMTTTLAAALIGVVVVEWAISSTASPGADGALPLNWRGVFAIYGLTGLAVALLFWIGVRNRPPVEVGSSDFTSSSAKPANELSFRQRVVLLARTRNMCLSGGMQFGVNIGWVFVVTYLPTYLKEVYRVPLEDVGLMQTVTLAIGCLGMIFGGVFTDFMRSRFGPRYGRSIPIGTAMSVCALVFILIPNLSSAWAVVIALGAMTFCVDMHNPSLWAFVQDIGGRNVGPAMGWGNMWGNLGAALSPVLLMKIRILAGWNVAFICCAGTFAAAAACGFMLDATKPIEPESD